MTDFDSRPDSVEAIAYRLRITREAMGLNQAQFCRRVGIAPNTWNQYEKARGRISLDEAEKLWRVERITLDWIYHGLIGLMPAKLADAIRELQAATRDQETAKRQSA